MKAEEKRKQMLDKIEELKKRIELVGSDIERERNESSEEDSAVRQELLDKKEILEQQIVELLSSLAMLNTAEEVQEAIGKAYTIEVNGSKREVQIVTPTEADPSKGMISLESPLAKALSGKNKGEVVNVETPAGTQTYKIHSVK